MIYKNFKFFLLIYFTLSVFNISANAKSAPESFADLAEKLMPSVVEISTTQTIKTSTNPFEFVFPPGSPFEDFFKDYNTPQERQATSLGSGFIIDKKGLVITNNHVIEGAEDIIVRVSDSTEYKVKVIGVDRYMDLAVLKIESQERFVPVSFGDSDKARVGDWVIAIGSNLGLGGTVTSGIISSKNRDLGGRYNEYIQTDASINLGNSGGPLFNMEGKVIGINVRIATTHGSSGSIGLGFAIPSNQASMVIDQLIQYGETKRGWLGVHIQEVTEEIAEIKKMEKAEGALIANVIEKSPADKAGMKAGDIILEFDGKKIENSRTLQRIVGQTKVGKEVVVKILRNQKLISKKIIVGRLESSGEFKAKIKPENEKKETSTIDPLKITVRILTDQDVAARKLPEGTKGLVITKIELTSPLNNLQVNDIIVEVQDKKITSIKMLNDIVNDVLQSDESNLLIVVYNNQNQRRFLGVKIK